MKCLILIGLILCVTPALADNVVSVRLTTDYEPRVDFTTIRYNLRPADQPGIHDIVTIRPFRGSSIVGQVLAVLATSDTGDFDVTVELIDDNGTRTEADDLLVARGSTEIHVLPDGNTAFLTINRPTRDVTREVTLFHDDDDGVAGAGDTMLYTIHIPGPTAAGVYTDNVGVGATLNPMSVTSLPDGAIEQGNDPGDTVVSVNVGALANGESTTVSFTGIVQPELVNQGVFEVQNVEFPTDDPFTPEYPDPNHTPVVTTSIASCSAIISDARAEIDALLNDSDGDSIIGARDDCLSTPARAVVDDRGCSQEEFCSTFTNSGPSHVPSACNDADWGNDEPLGAADCTERGRQCVALPV